MIAEQRDPAFWRAVAAHPAVEPHVSLGRSFDIGEVVVHPGVTPIASEHGGYLFLRLDELGRIFEWHALFTPEGWGREALLTAKEALERMFALGAVMVTMVEVEGNWRSSPPLSFGWKPLGGFEPDGRGNSFKSWFLTVDAWRASPARKRNLRCLLS